MLATSLVQNGLTNSLLTASTTTGAVIETEILIICIALLNL